VTLLALTTTYFIKNCIAGTTTFTYSHYDKPAILLEMPPKVTNATPMTMPSPLRRRLALKD